MGAIGIIHLERELKMVEKINSIPGYKRITLVHIKPDKVTTLDLLDFDMKGLDRKELIDWGYTLAKRRMI